MRKSEMWDCDCEGGRLFLGEVSLFMVVLLSLQKGMGRLLALQQVSLPEIRSTSRLDGQGTQLVLTYWISRQY